MLIKTDPDIIQSYFQDKSYLPGGHADKVFFPESTDDLKTIIKNAVRTHTPLTISGSGTGTTGGRVPFGGSVITMEKLKHISLNQNKNHLTVEAGVTLEEISNYLEPNGLIYPPDPTEVSAQIGSTIANNSSGARTFKFGPTRAWISGLKVVLPSGQTLGMARGQYSAKGQILHIPQPLDMDIKIPSYKIPETKNAAGYYSKHNMDLIDLFIGSEGTLGVITEATLNLMPSPRNPIAFYIFTENQSTALNLAAKLRSTGQAIQNKNQVEKTSPPPLIEPVCIEYYDSYAITLLKNIHPNIPLKAQACLYCEQWITDIHPFSGEQEDIYLNAWSEFLDPDVQSIIDIWYADKEKELKTFKEIRHSLPAAINERIAQYKQPKISMDFAVPSTYFAKHYDNCMKILKNTNLEWLQFGHIGDCHLHLNILPKSEQQLQEANVIYDKLASLVLKNSGTITAEHGIGKIKHKYLRMMYGEKGVNEMKLIKQTLDPQGILNTGNLFTVSPTSYA